MSVLPHDAAAAPRTRTAPMRAPGATPGARRGHAAPLTRVDEPHTMSPARLAVIVALGALAWTPIILLIRF